ncbi:MAG: AbrB/MazE/SpoVT family DNA-binding domain-containing protein [Alphaproteobacteria bacterium]|nr:AbrB/MazE/SpoVT family DNA-binding domain-containing protein [Pseudomonadota bacterium]MCH8137924.1 AbrB/MazE/SpoVT family DNA-binding domain-containing protein [Pseudomonadota bacterium]MCZ6482366.1 AbrB/MazE/SpoVT family DNA-binding domain-containing protein [Alphaproteobacteria bacterium]
MRSFIGKWGNSLALRLPRHLAGDIRLFEGTEVDLSIRDGSLVVTPARPRYRLADLLRQTGKADKDGEYDWGPPRGEEEW